MQDLIAAGRLDRHFLVIDGRLRGGWRRRLGVNSATVTIDAWEALTPAEYACVDVEVRRYAAFLDKAVELACER